MYGMLNGRTICLARIHSLQFRIQRKRFAIESVNFMNANA